MQAAGPPVTSEVDAKSTSKTLQSEGAPFGAPWPNLAPTMPLSFSLGSTAPWRVEIITPGIPGWSIAIVPILALTNCSLSSCLDKRAMSATK